MNAKAVWLVIGNEELNSFLETYLGSHGYAVDRLADGPSALAKLGRGDFPSLILSDDSPPGIARSTFESRVREVAPFIRCVFLGDSKIPAKPDQTREFSADDITLNAPELLELLDKLAAQADLDATPTSGLPAAPDETKRSLLTTIASFVQLIERYEFINGGNGPLVQRFAVEVARELGLSTDRVDALAAASLLYDIGMMRVRPEVKLKTEALSPEELKQIREHPRHSAEFCESLRLPWDVSRYILHHHERYDGRGYPGALEGRKIPIGARILAVGDAYFAMIGKRPNREPVSEAEALDELRRNAGLQFDPEIVEIWTSLIQVRFLGNTVEGEEPGQRCIALVDDDRELRVLLDMKFSALGYKVVIVDDPGRVLPLLIDAGPEAVIVNADLSWLDGLQLLHRVRQQPGLGGVPFIFMRASKVSPGERAQASAAGADDYIVRPTPLQEVVSRVNSAIRKKRRLTGAHFVRPPVPAGIRGRLAEMSLAEICQILSQGFKTAKVSITDPRTEGYLYFESGKLKHATCDERQGAEAFYELLKIKEGEFAIEHGVGPPDETIRERVEFLLMEGMRIMDEEARAASQ